ncbi:hypothetical protein [Yoonia sp.]|uniref:hypothetical protein n=1 Tax=Yoonia sp. TaxID=2212373 RepID=UPI002DFF8A4A|nr:hypothetical protein [Yoonia sp.]
MMALLADLAVALGVAGVVWICGLLLAVTRFSWTEPSVLFFAGASSVLSFGLTLGWMLS